jgi:hypothetical protein
LLLLLPSLPPGILFGCTDDVNDGEDDIVLTVALPDKRIGAVAIAIAFAFAFAFAYSMLMSTQKVDE